MNTAAAVLGCVIFGFLLIVVPVAGRFRYNQLKQRIASGVPDAKLRFYRRGLLQQLILTAAVLGYCGLGSVPLSAIGLGAPGSWVVSLAVMIGSIIGLALSVVRFRTRGDDKLKRVLDMAGGLIPTSPSERRWYAAVGTGAGIVEELACRGFVLYYLSSLFPSLDSTSLIIISAAIFGFGHLYQGRRGVLLTAVVGCLLAALYVVTGSLLAPMVIHAALDLRILALFTPARLRSLTASTAAMNPQPELCSSGAHVQR